MRGEGSSKPGREVKARQCEWGRGGGTDKNDQGRGNLVGVEGEVQKEVNV